MAAAILPMFTDNKSHQQYNPDTRIHKIISYTRPKEVLVQVVSGLLTLCALILFLNTSTLDVWTVHSSPSTAWAVTPLLIYPLLPSRGLFSIPCEVFLIWPTALGILHHFGSMILDSINEQLPSHPWQFWQAPLMWLTLLAGCDMLSSKRRERESDKEKNFQRSSDEATYWLLHVPVLTWVIVPCFRNLADEADWLWFGVHLLLLLVYVRAFIGVAHILNQRIIRLGVWCFASRRISSWTWLPQNGAERDFEPLGAKVLEGWVLAMPFVLTVIMAIPWSV
ncbi:hypothetical protein DL546_003559 [Coniochaeta pulveracea]|uniref:Uncharacterized protein n=1 Tax=Coniochaeta pulveracea TaxID=177199 RepID=A0A420YCE8_9PEZI|nr:hypothetical protein DL546_003559 [Coniochaeta pulveracea]